MIPVGDDELIMCEVVYLMSDQLFPVMLHLMHGYVYGGIGYLRRFGEPVSQCLYVFRCIISLHISAHTEQYTLALIVECHRPYQGCNDIWIQLYFYMGKHISGFVIGYGISA